MTTNPKYTCKTCNDTRISSKRRSRDITENSIKSQKCTWEGGRKIAETRSLPSPPTGGSHYVGSLLMMIITVFTPASIYLAYIYYIVYKYGSIYTAKW